MKWLLAVNLETTLLTSKIWFKPYSSDKTVPILGKWQVCLCNQASKTINITVYVASGQAESLLGKEDAEALGIIKLNPQGDPQVKDIQVIKTEKDKWERVRCIMPTTLEKPSEKIISGGKPNSKSTRQ